MSGENSISKMVNNFRYTKDLINMRNVTIGDYTYGVPQIRWVIGNEKVTIGKFCSFSGGVEILMTANHPIDTVSCYPFPALQDIWPGAQGKCPLAKGDINIGNDVWIGLGATIMSGVTIGNGAVIGAHAVITKDVAPYSITVGNPAREARKRFGDETIAMLQEVRWWDWDEDKIRRNIAVITSKDIWKLKDCE